MSEEYWIISVPGKTAPGQRFQEVCQATKRDDLSENFLFDIPDLKVGTLDSLVALSDELARLDSYTESVTRKLTQFFFNDVLQGDRNRLSENLIIGNFGDPISYLTKFQWDHAKYPTKQSLKNLSEIMSKAATHIETELKTRGQSFNNVKQSLESMQKKQSGSLLTRNLDELLKKEHFILGSEYLKTVLVCVPRPLVNEWHAKYERLCEYIVPKSSELITQDQDHALFTVTLFQRTEDCFRTRCRENKFVVRDYTYDEKALASEREKMQELEKEQQKIYANTVRWLKIHFAEIFSTSLHVKAMHVFVESVLRFGLPVDFVAMLIHPTKKSTKRLRELLDRMFGHLDQIDRTKADEQIDIPGLFASQQEYYPYVYFKLDLDYLDMNKK